MNASDSIVVRYSLDPGRSRFLVRAFAGGLLSAFAHSPTIAIRDFAGEARFSPDSPEAASLSVRVNADSLEVTDDVSAKDRQEIERKMRQEVLETSRYPDVVFESTNVSAKRIDEGEYQAAITGKVSLRGVTSRCVIKARVKIDGDGLRAQGEFPLRQSAFDIKPVTAAAGTIRLKDELKLSFDIIAHQEMV
jgi:polyisoprenoid-binding protein YceI